MGGKLFGFASCPRAVGAAEGMNVLAERRVPLSPHQGEQPTPPRCCQGAESSSQVSAAARLPGCSWLLGCRDDSVQRLDAG
jgi:hypothetical protein